MHRVIASSGGGRIEPYRRHMRVLKVRRRKFAKFRISLSMTGMSSTLVVGADPTPIRLRTQDM
jgi:hypothetical protein